MSYDPRQVKIGRRIEREHTDDPAEAERIAKDHLRENPRYYPTGQKPKNAKEALRYEADKLLPRPPKKTMGLIKMSEHEEGEHGLWLAPQIGDRVATTTNDGEYLEGVVLGQWWDSILFKVDKPAHHAGKEFMGDRGRVVFADTGETHRPPGWEPPETPPPKAAEMQVSWT